MPSDTPATPSDTHHCIFAGFPVSPAKPCLLPPSFHARCLQYHPLCFLFDWTSGQSGGHPDQPWAQGCIAAPVTGRHKARLTLPGARLGVQSCTT